MASRSSNTAPWLPGLKGTTEDYLLPRRTPSTVASLASIGRRGMPQEPSSRAACRTTGPQANYHHRQPQHPASSQTQAGPRLPAPPSYLSSTRSDPMLVVPGPAHKWLAGIPDESLREEMGELASSPHPTAVLPVVFVDGDQSVDLGTATVHPSLGVRKLQAVVADRVGVGTQQISAFLARPRRARRVPLDVETDLAAVVAREGSGCYALAVLRRTRHERRGGRSRRGKKAPAAAAAKAVAPSAPPSERTILKRLPPTDLASLAASPPPVMFGAWDYEAQLCELQQHRARYLMRTAAVDPYAPLTPEREGPPLWSTRPRSWQACPGCALRAAVGEDHPEEPSADGSGLPGRVPPAGDVSNALLTLLLRADLAAPKKRPAVALLASTGDRWRAPATARRRDPDGGWEVKGRVGGHLDDSDDKLCTLNLQEHLDDSDDKI